MTPPEQHEEIHPHGSICTRSGERFFPFEPRGRVLLEDIAWATSQKVRFTGHMLGLYTVAQHQVHVSEVVEAAGHRPTIWLQALLHDASEAYLPDVASPLKAHLLVGRGPSPEEVKVETFRNVEARLLAYIFHCLGLGPCDPAVKEADLAVFLAEKRDLMPVTDWWDAAESGVPLASAQTPTGPLRCWTPHESFINFIDRLHYCLAAMAWSMPSALALYFRRYLVEPAGPLVPLDRAFEAWEQRAMRLLVSSLRV